MKNENQHLNSTRKGDYDYSYPKNLLATYTGIVLLLINLFFWYYPIKLDQASGSYDESKALVSLVTISIQTASGIYAYNIADKLNRGKWGWFFFGLIASPLALIIIGQLRKMNFHLIVDESYSESERYKAVKALGDKFIVKKKYKEAYKAYQYINQNLTPTETDKKILESLNQKLS